MRKNLIGIALFVTMVACGGSDETSSPPPTYALTGFATLSGQPSSGGLVVTLIGPSTAATVTAADGAYDFAGLRDGTYAVTATAGSTLERVRTVAVQVEGADASADPIAFTPVGILAGRVTLGAATGNAGISVIVAGTSAAGMTDDAGDYVIADVPAGSHDVVATLPGYAAGLAPAVDVPFGTTGSVPDLVLSPGGTAAIRGSAFLAGGGAAAGATVTVDGTAFATTVADDGSFELTGMPDGAYTVTIDAGDYGDRIPGVIAVAGGSGYLLDGSLYPMLPIDLPRGRRLASEYAGDGWSVAPGGGAVALAVDKALGGAFTLEVAPLDGPTRIVAGDVTGYGWNADGSRLWARTRDGSGGGQVLIHTVATGETRVVGGAPDLNSVSWLDEEWVRISTYTAPNIGYSLASAAGSTLPLGTNAAYYGYDAATRRYLWGTVTDGVYSLELADLAAGTSSRIAANVSSVSLLGAQGAALFFDAPAAGRGTLKILRLATGAVETVEADAAVGSAASPDKAKVLYKGAGDALKLLTVSTGATVQVATNVYVYAFLNDAWARVWTDRDTVTGATTLRMLDVAAGSTTVLATTVYGNTPYSGTSPGGAHLYYFSSYDSGTNSATLGVFTFATKANYPAVATGVRTSNVSWTPNGNRIQFLKTDGTLHSYLVGGTPVQIAAATVAGYMVTADSAHAIVFRGYAYPIYASVGWVSLGGGAETTIATNASYSYALSPSGATMYLLNAYDGVTFMGTLRAVNTATAARTDMATSVYAVIPSPDSAGVVFWKDRDAATGLAGAYVAAAFSTAPTYVGPLAAPGDVKFSPDGHTAVVRWSHYWDATNEMALYYARAVPVTGGTPGPYLYNVYDYWVVDGRFNAKIAFNRANGTAAGLYAVPFNGSAVSLGSQVQSSTVSTSPDGSRLAFVRSWDAARGTGILSVVSQTSTAVTDVLDRAASFSWFTAGGEPRLLARREGTPPPFRFQDGAYVMSPLP